MNTELSLDLPMVSVLMPVRNEAAMIARALVTILSQDYPKDRFEVIVADGISTDKTRHIIQIFLKQYANLKLIDNPGRIASTALNTALEQAQGEIILRIDGHCEVNPDYVRRCVEHLLNDGVQCVGGSLETIGKTNIGQTIALAMSSPFGVGNASFRTTKNKTILTDTVAFPAYTRHIIAQAGPFDKEMVLNEDDEYNYRLRKIGAKILLAHDIRIKYYCRESLRTLWSQYFQYGFWKVRLLQKHARQMRPRHFVPFAFVTALGCTSALALFFPFGRLLLALLLSAYSIANLAAAIWTACKNGWKSVFLLPLVFSTLHLSYGLGFYAGLVHFRKQWKK